MFNHPKSFYRGKFKSRSENSIEKLCFMDKIMVILYEMSSIMENKSFQVDETKQ